MASYSTMSTIPAADVETEQPLLKRDVKLNVKTVLAGAAGAAFMATGQRQCFEMKCGFFDWRRQDATSYDWQINHRCPLVPYLARIARATTVSSSRAPPQ